MLDDSNQYVVLSILITAAALAGLGFALSRFISIISMQGFILTTGHITMSFIILGFTTMAIYYILSIIEIKIGPTAPESFYLVFSSLPEVLTILACLVVSLYW